MSAALETRPLSINLQFLRENIQAAQRKNCPQTEYVVHGPFQSTYPSFKEESGNLSAAIKKEESYSSDSSETIQECQLVIKKQVSPENMDVDHDMLPWDGNRASGACHGLQGSEQVVVGQDEMLTVARIENGMENDSDSDDGAVQLNNPERGPDIFIGLVEEAKFFSTGKI